MVIIRRSVRASSVPVAPSDLTLDINLSSAGRITSSALDDTDALMLASKRHDQQLLSDINARLASASFTQPMTTIKRSSQHKDKPPLPPTAAGRTLRRYVVVDHADEDLIEMPATPVTSSVIRASSVPPRLPTVGRGRVIRTDSHVMSSQYGGLPPVNSMHDPHSTFSHRSLSLASSSPLPTDLPVAVSLTPVADLAVRQAHRNLDRIDKEIKFTYDHPNGPHKFPPKSAYVTEVHPVVPRRSSYVHLPSHTSTVQSVKRTSSLSPARNTSFQYHHRHHHPSPSPSDILLNTMSSSSLPVQGGHISQTFVPPVDLHDEHVTSDLLKMIDVESPAMLTHVYKPHVKPYKPYVASYVTPAVITPHLTPVVATPYVAPAHVTGGVITAPVLPTRDKEHVIDYAPKPVTSGRPKLSETRRKVREVLCRVRNDPHYFD